MSSENEDEDKYEKKAEKKRLKKLEKSLETGLLDPWERYRILTDLYEQYVDLAELADRKTRFALVILGAINAANLIVAMRPNLLPIGPGVVPRWLGAYVAMYLGLSVVIFAQAIRALKPRTTSLLAKVDSLAKTPEGWPKLRFIGDMIGQAPEEYYERWRGVQFGQVNRELAFHLQLVAQVNASKYMAIERLFIGLLILVVLTAVLLTTLIYTSLTQ